MGMGSVIMPVVTCVGKSWTKLDAVFKNNHVLQIKKWKGFKKQLKTTVYNKK